MTRRISAGSTSAVSSPEHKFSRESSWTAVNDAGFIVRIEESSGVSYEDVDGRVFLDAEGRVFLEAERLADGLRVRLDSPRSQGLERAEPERVCEVIGRIIRGLRFLGYQCETVGRIRRLARRRWVWPR